MQTDIHSNWKGSENERYLKSLRKHCKKENKAISHYMIEATKEKMLKNGISP